MAEGRSYDPRNGIDVRDTGDPDAATVLVYLPGLGETGEVFASLFLAEPLAGFRHVVLDYADWTKPTLPGETIALEAGAERIAEWIVANVSRPVVLVGHSMGGVIAQLLAEKHPELVAKLVDIEGNISRDDCMFSGTAVAYSLDAFVAHGFAERKSALMRDADHRTRRYAERLDTCAATTYYAFAEPLVRISQEETLAARLAELPMPALYVYGQDLGRGISERSREMLRHNGVCVAPVEHAGHWVYLDQPQQFTRVVRDFIDR